MTETLNELLDLGIDPEQAARMVECVHVMKEVFSVCTPAGEIMSKLGELPSLVSKKPVCQKCGYGFWK